MEFREKALRRKSDRFPPVFLHARQAAAKYGRKNEIPSFLSHDIVLYSVLQHQIWGVLDGEKGVA